MQPHRVVLIIRSVSHHHMPFSIRLAEEQDFLGLAAIETEARARFSDNDMPAELRGYCTPPHELHASHREGLLWVAEVAGRGVVGFLAAALFERGIHVLQMSVRPAEGRMGIGTTLLSRVHQETMFRKLKHVSLTTFAHIPWNAPAYSKCGFIALEPHQLTPALRERLANENAAGLSHRVAMRKCADWLSCFESL